jgi:hypothetical protein
MNNLNEKALEAAAEVIFNNTGHGMPPARNIAKAAITAYQAALPDDDLVERVAELVEREFINGTEWYINLDFKDITRFIIAALNNNKGGV